MVVAFRGGALSSCGASFAAAVRVEVSVAGGAEVVTVLAGILELFPAGVLLVGIRELVLVGALETGRAGGAEVVPGAGGEVVAAEGGELVPSPMSVEVVSPLAGPASLELLRARVLAAVVGLLLVPAGAGVKATTPVEVKPEAVDMVGGIPPDCEAAGRRLRGPIGGAGARTEGPDAAGRYSSGGCAP